MQSVPTHPLVDPSEIKRHDSDLVSGLTSEATDLKRELVDVERLADTEPGTLGGLDLIHTKDPKYILQAKVGQVKVYLCNLQILHLLVLGCFLFERLGVTLQKDNPE